MQHFRLESVVAAKYPKNLQQAQKQIVDRYVQRDRSHDVVGLAAMDDCTGLIENQAAHQQNKHR